VRDILKGEKTYKELQNGPEKIPTNILAARLKMLVNEEILFKKPYQDNPPRFTYALTEKGYALWPLLRELIRWGDKYIPEAKISPEARTAIGN
jgi:DNA-binding HxlR family transcriptional regulator